MTPRLEILPAEGPGGGSKGGVLNPDGSFEVEGVGQGTWRLRIEQGLLTSSTVLGTTTVQIDDHDIEGVAVTVQAPLLVKGFVRIEEEDKPIPEGLTVRLESPDELVWDRSVTLRSGGNFEIDNLPPGRYRVYIRGAAAEGYFVKSVRYGTLESSAAEFSLTAAGEMLLLTLSSRGARVSGVVKRRGPSGSATPQVVLVPNTADARLRSYDTRLGSMDQGGGFAVKGVLRPGDYTLYAFEGVPEGAWREADFLRELEGKGVGIKLGEGDAKTVEAPLVPRSEIGPTLAWLGMDPF